MWTVENGAKEKCGSTVIEHSRASSIKHRAFLPVDMSAVDASTSDSVVPEEPHEQEQQQQQQQQQQQSEENEQEQEQEQSKCHCCVHG